MHRARSVSDVAPKTAERSLATRVANPPAVFVTRGALLANTVRALARAPVTTIWGLGGLGKSALASAAIAKHVERHSDLYTLALRAPEPPADPATALLHAFDEPWTAGSESELDARLIDVAERAGSLVLLEDAHRVAPDRAARLTERLARYARRSRWLVTARRRIEVPELAGQEIAVEPWSERDLTRLAHALGAAADQGGHEAIARMVREALGSPWRLRLLARSPAAPVDVLSTLPDDARALAEVLSWIGRAVDASRLPAAARVAVAELAAWAFVEQDHDTIRMHELTRALVRDALPAARGATRRAEARALLATDPDPAGRLDAIRLALDDAEVDAAIELYERDRGVHIAAGHAPALWSWLGEALPTRARIELAVEVGPAAVATLRAPTAEESDVTTALAWARALYARGELVAARDAAAALRERSSTPAALADEALLLEASAAALAGDGARAQTILERARCEGIAHEARRLAGLAQIMRANARWEDAAPLVAALERLSSGPLEERARASVSLALFWARRDMGDHGSALAALRSGIGGAHQGSEWNVLGRAARVLELQCAVERGEYAEARRIRGTIPPHAALEAVNEEALHLFDALLALADGRLEAVREAVRERERTRTLTPAYGARWIALARELAWRTGSPATSWPLPSPREHQRLGADLACLVERERALRWSDAAGVGGESPGTDAPETRVHEARVRALMALSRGAPSQAVDHARAALGEASRTSFGALALEARVLLCDLAFAAGDPRWRDEVAEALRAAEVHAAPRVRAELALQRGVLERVEVESLVALREDANAAPAVRRRSAALLGDELPLDLVDRALVPRLAQELGIRVRTTREGAPTCWIDLERARVIASDGSAISFGEDTVAWKLLVVLAIERAPESRDELVRRVWGYAQYHPARHDNPLKLAARSLRARLAEASRPTLTLVSTAAGYDVRSGVRVIERARDQR